MALRIALLGASGKMGQRIAQLAASDPSFELTDLKSCAVIIDFSHASMTSKHLAMAIELNKPLVLGTTGHDEKQKEEIREAAKQIPLFFSPNFAFGVALCLDATAKIADALGEECTISIVETHHVHKKDVPSGTALCLAEATGNRAEITSVRDGEIIGEHRVTFTWGNETIEVTHRAHSRNAFALGALKAAQFLSTKLPGLYSSF